MNAGNGGSRESALRKVQDYRADITHLKVRIVVAAF